MANQQQMIRLMQDFVRRYVSSGANVTEVFYRQLSATWVGYVRLDAGLEAKLVAVRQGEQWDIKIRDMMMVPFLPPTRSGASKPPEPMKLKSVRLKLDRCYADGLISYEEYCRRLRLIGQR